MESREWSEFIGVDLNLGKLEPLQHKSMLKVALSFSKCGCSHPYQVVKVQTESQKLYVVWGPLLLDQESLNLSTALHEHKVKKDDDYSNCGNVWYK